MNFLYLLMGGILILIGFLVKAFPNSIAGYNTLSKEKKKNIDVEGLSSMMLRVMLVTGAMVIVIPSMIDWQGHRNVADLSMMVLFMSGILVAMVWANRFDGNKKTAWKKVLPAGFVVVVFMGVGFFLHAGVQEPDIFVKGDEITISGQYGLTAGVISAQLLDEIPRIKMKTNGLGFGNVRKGDFRLEGWGTCRLFLQSDEGPYIKLETNKMVILLNLDAPGKTRDLFSQIQNRKL